MRGQKNLNLKQYTQGVGQFIFTSQFIYAHNQNLSSLKKLQLQIQTRKQKKIHYLYLWLLTQRIPYLQPFYPSWKNTSTNLFLKPKAKSHSLQVTLPSKNIFSILHEILFEIIAKQTHSEKKIFVFQKQILKVMIFSAAITKKTYGLQTKNTYFPNIPLILKFRFSNTTAFQKLFFLRFLKVVSPVVKLAALDSFFEHNDFPNDFNHD